MASSSSNLPEMFKNLDNILATHDHGKNLHTQIHTFAPKDQEVFFDQVVHRYILAPDVAAHIKQGGEQTLNSYIQIVEELLARNPYNGFYPLVVVDAMSQQKLCVYLNQVQKTCTYDNNKSVVTTHIFEALIRYKWMRAKLVSNLFELVGYVAYRYNEIDCTAPVTIFLPASYPEDRPIVSIDCPGDWAINPEHMNVAPNGLVTIPFIVKWDGKSSDLVQLLSHLCVDFTCQHPIFPIDAGGMELSLNQKKLLRILLDYQIMHLYYGVQALTPEERSDFFKKVTGRYPQNVDLPYYIRTTKGGVKKFIKIVAEILHLPPKKRTTVDVADLDFLP